MCCTVLWKQPSDLWWWVQCLIITLYHWNTMVWYRTVWLLWSTQGRCLCFVFLLFFILYFYIFILFLLSVIQPQNVDDGVLTLCLCSFGMHICWQVINWNYTEVCIEVSIAVCVHFERGLVISLQLLAVHFRDCVITCNCLFILIYLWLLWYVYFDC